MPDEPQQPDHGVDPHTPDRRAGDLESTTPTTSGDGADASPVAADVPGTTTIVDVTTHGAAEAKATPPRRRRRLDRGLLAASAVIAGGIVLIAWGLLGAVTGDEGVDRPDVIEDLGPIENAVQALQQSRIFVDLEFGYEAELEIDGLRLPTTRIGELELEPGEQADLPPTAVYDAGNAVISFQPTDGAPIESFDEGRHEARVIFWKIDEGREFARSYVWSFDVI